MVAVYRFTSVYYRTRHMKQQYVFQCKKETYGI